MAVSSGYRAHQGPERPGSRVLGTHRGVPGVHDNRHPRLGEQAPDLLEQRVVRREAAHLQVHLEDARTRVQRLAHVARRPGFRVERRRRQAPRRVPAERHRPRVQVGRHARPVRVGKRAEQPHSHRPQVRHPLGVAPPVADRPARADQRPRLVEVLPHPPQQPRRQEVHVNIRQPRHPERPPEPRNVAVLLWRQHMIHPPIQLQPRPHPAHRVRAATPSAPRTQLKIPMLNMYQGLPPRLRVSVGHAQPVPGRAIGG